MRYEVVYLQHTLVTDRVDPRQAPRTAPMAYTAMFDCVSPLKGGGLQCYNVKKEPVPAQDGAVLYYNNEFVDHTYFGPGHWVRATAVKT